MDAATAKRKTSPEEPVPTGGISWLPRVHTPPGCRGRWVPHKARHAGTPTGQWVTASGMPQYLALGIQPSISSSSTAAHPRGTRVPQPGSAGPQLWPLRVQSHCRGESWRKDTGSGDELYCSSVALILYPCGTHRQPPGLASKRVSLSGKVHEGLVLKCGL